MKTPLTTLLQPVGLNKALNRYNFWLKERRVRRYWENLSVAEINHAVDYTIEEVRQLTDAQTCDARYLEEHLIPKLGLNNEMLQEQPQHLSEHYGKGLHIWQYPNQLGPFLAWLANHGSSIGRYLEIGARWGGTFIVISEFLRRINPRFSKSIAVDPIRPSRLLKRYLEVGRCEYLQCCSTDKEFEEALARERPDFVFIDGDHTLNVVMHDYDLCSNVSKYLAFHDIASDGCSDTTLLWAFLKKHCALYKCAEFTRQYDSVKGSFMGIGVMVRK